MLRDIEKELENVKIKKSNGKNGLRTESQHTLALTPTKLPRPKLNFKPLKLSLKRRN